MERKNTGQLSLACTGNLRDNRQPSRLGSVLPSSNAIIWLTSLYLFCNRFKICIYHKWSWHLFLIIFKLQYIFTFFWHPYCLFSIYNHTVVFINTYKSFFVFSLCFVFLYIILSKSLINT